MTRNTTRTVKEMLEDPRPIAGGAVGSGGALLANLPAQDFDVNEDLFFQLTQKTEITTKTIAWPGPGAPVNVELPHAGLLSHITVTFEGTVAGEALGAAADPLWAYRLLKSARFGGSGQTDLLDAEGIDYHVLRFIRNPALNRGTEFYNTSADENGNFRVAWDIPIAADMTSLAASIFAQSQASQLWLKLRTATLAELGITAAGAAITGNFKIHQTWFEIPFDPAGTGKIILPDIRRTHGLVQRDTNFSNTGEVSVSLYRPEGQIMRIIGYVDLGGGAGGVAVPVDFAAANPAIERIGFEFGANQRPLDWDPAWLLAKKNGDHYGAQLPQGYFCIDLVRENAVRDMILMPGITDPELNIHVRAGTAVGANAHVHVVEEVLYL